MAEAHAISSSMVSNCKLFKHDANTFSDPTLYRFVVATLTRAKIRFAVNKAS